MPLQAKCINCENPHLTLPALLQGEQGSPVLTCKSCDLKFCFDSSGYRRSGLRELLQFATRFQVPGYKLVGVLARGGMGYVYTAIRESDNMLVAIKVLAPELRDIPGITDRFCREARIMRSLRHPGIVQILDANPDHEFPYVVMPFYPGRTLKRRLLASPQLDIGEILAVLVPVGQAIYYLHDSGFIHRDLKPSNIMLTMKGEVFLLDMGIARGVQDDLDLTINGADLGTPAYNAPEIFEYAESSFFSDQYSLAVITYQMLAGILPMGVFPRPRDVNSELPRDSEKALLRALAHDPEERFATIKDFVRSFVRPIYNFVPAADSLKYLIAEAAAPTADELDAKPGYRFEREDPTPRRQTPTKPFSKILSKITGT